MGEAKVSSCVWVRTELSSQNLVEISRESARLRRLRVKNLAVWELFVGTQCLEGTLIYCEVTTQVIRILMIKLISLTVTSLVLSQCFVDQDIDLQGSKIASSRSLAQIG